MMSPNHYYHINIQRSFSKSVDRVFKCLKISSEYINGYQVKVYEGEDYTHDGYLRTSGMKYRETEVQVHLDYGTPTNIQEKIRKLSPELFV